MVSFYRLHRSEGMLWSPGRWRLDRTLAIDAFGLGSSLETAMVSQMRCPDSKPVRPGQLQVSMAVYGPFFLVCLSEDPARVCDDFVALLEAPFAGDCPRLVYHAH